jgi:hypothetical protein
MNACLNSRKDRSNAIGNSAFNPVWGRLFRQTLRIRRAEVVPIEPDEANMGSLQTQPGIGAVTTTSLPEATSVFFFTLVDPLPVGQGDQLDAFRAAEIA